MTLQALAWLSGDWVGEGECAGLEMHFSEPGGGSILATSRWAAQRHREFLCFETDAERGGVILTILRPGAEETRFSWLEDAFVADGERLILANPSAGRLAIRYTRQTRTFEFALRRSRRSA